ncbi:beta-ketoacyl-ACP synthase III [Garciella nitratireducens]|uniref:beta-ketoacyl-ACP synthase III n=1 Tax=Garciella nitratireducens TaxID=218205 RepID=UPI000DE8BDD3|nr:beta-ketoacyl-ACP synthase III [Garciella nitratireducens]RBP41128.1 3-oxoacyl-[acyl-carrier-protein] synthase III [Garciella nitratireducens]
MGVIITGTGHYVPERVLTNYDLEKMVDTSDEWITTRTGIKERRIASENESTSTLATKAARRALDSAGISPEEIDLILVATATPDMLFPSVSCLVQDQLGAVNAAAFDIEAACTGFIYALTIAQQFIITDFYSKILVIGAETLSKITDYTDRNTCVLFGDGAGAVVLEKGEEGKGILTADLGADGTGGKLLRLPAGGSLHPASIKTVEKKMHYTKMDGKEVFKFAARNMASSAIKSLNKVNMNVKDIDYLIPHQANIRIIENAAKRLHLEKEKIYVNIDKYGNMSSASIPVALDEAVKGHFIKKDDTIVLVGFGGGLTWGSIVIKW